jgi:hypothetical protein
MQTRYKNEAGLVCGFSKFITSGSGLSSRFSKFQIRVWVRVLSSGSKPGTGLFASLLFFYHFETESRKRAPSNRQKKSLNKNRIHKLHYVI